MEVDLLPHLREVPFTVSWKKKVLWFVRHQLSGPRLVLFYILLHLFFSLYGTEDDPTVGRVFGVQAFRFLVSNNKTTLPPLRPHLSFHE